MFLKEALFLPLEKSIFLLKMLAIIRRDDALDFTEKDWG